MPGQWEQQGFGTYNYGHDKKKTADVGFYRHSFAAPEAWRGRRVELFFEGVMTDTLATVNGQPAGPRHQGGFTRLSLRRLVRCCATAATTCSRSRCTKSRPTTSVEDAERQADYWVFGGIYRPVYLAISPPEAIDYWPLDARADGSLRAPVRLAGLAAPAELELRVETLAGAPVGSPLRPRPPANGTSFHGTFAGIAPWNAEEPNLYRAVLELRRGDAILHRASKKFGFRTVELRNQGGPGDGLYVNGRRILLKGANRHVFYPDTGRTSSPERDRADAELAKSLHLNAVRTSHYPPDVAFLDACDELGLYVIDELPGWHHAYGTEPGRQDPARRWSSATPTIPRSCSWANGNEGGHNFDLVPEFARHDPQGRLVLHPQKRALRLRHLALPDLERADGAARSGQPAQPLARPLGVPPLFLPTEFQHALYDGGGGAALADFWAAIRASPLGVGGFLWAFTDEAISRSDRGGALDTDGNHAPDGILGPWREPSGSVAGGRRGLRPGRLSQDPLPPGAGLAGWDGRLAIENRNDFLDLGPLPARPGAPSPGPAIRDPRAGRPAALPLPKAAPGGERVPTWLALPWRGGRRPRTAGRRIGRPGRRPAGAGGKASNT